MNRDKFKSFHRQARLGNLGSLAMSVSNSLYGWLLSEVYDPRFPHVGDDRHAMRDRIANFGRTAGKTQNALAQWHYKRGWLNCWHKSLLRLWVEYKAITMSKETP